MSEWLLLAFFLPLFPFSSVFVLLCQRLPSAYLRSAILLIWPQIGLILAANMSEPLPQWLLIWGVGTALLYAFRSLVVRELNHWVSFIAVSSWSVFWLLLSSDTALHLILLGVSTSLALLTLLSREIDKKHATVYVGVISGLAHGKPKLAGLMTITLLMIIGTPLAPSFFNNISLIAQQLPISTALTVMLVMVWFFISWSGMRVYQQLMTGEYTESIETDISLMLTQLYGLAIIAIIVFGLFFGGALV